jgi:hypothetical protein
MSRPELPNSPRSAPLRIEEIVRRADEWFAVHRQWPNSNSGKTPDVLDDV